MLTSLAPLGGIVFAIPISLESRAPFHPQPSRILARLFNACCWTSKLKP